MNAKYRDNPSEITGASGAGQIVPASNVQPVATPSPVQPIPPAGSALRPIILTDVNSIPTAPAVWAATE